MAKFIKRNLKKFFNTKEKRRLLENFFSLSALQAVNYLLPIITLPYLVRVLGPEKYGLIAFAQAFIQYFIILTDYGFNLSATREISINRGNKDKVSEIFSAVITIKIILMLISFVILLVLVFAVTKFRSDKILYLLTFGMVFGNVFFPVWFFQGMERMKYITFLNVIARSIFTISIFIFIKRMQDYTYVPLINSLGYLISCILSIIIIDKKFSVKLTIPSVNSIKYQLKEGWHIFISTIAVNIYTTSNAFLLGLFTNNTLVGYYAGAQKIVKAAQMLLRPVSQSVYPHVNKLVNKSKENGLKFLRKLIFPVGIVSFIISVLLFIFSKQTIMLILGKKYMDSIPVLKVLAFLPFIIALSNIFGVQTMLTFNYKSAFSRILLIASILDLLLAFILIPVYKHIGTALTVLVTEIFVTITMFIFLQSKGINLLRYKHI